MTVQFRGHSANKLSVYGFYQFLFITKNLVGYYST